MGCRSMCWVWKGSREKEVIYFEYAVSVVVSRLANPLLLFYNMSLTSGRESAIYAIETCESQMMWRPDVIERKAKTRLRP